MIKKVIGVFIISGFVISNLQGCNINGKNNSSTKLEQENNQEYKKLARYFEEKKVFFINEAKKIIYNGYCESGYMLNEKVIDKETYKIIYQGEMADGYGEDERGSRKIKITYNFNLNEGNTPFIYESVENGDYLVENKDSLYSIIKNYIVLLGEIEDGKTWTQKVEFKGKEYEARTKMNVIAENKYKLNTVINNIEGFYENTYKEERTYEKGKGLISFSNRSFSNNDELKEEESVFGYQLTEIK